MIKRIFFLALFLLALAAAAQAGFIAGSNSLTTTAESLATPRLAFGGKRAAHRLSSVIAAIPAVSQSRKWP